VPPGLTLPGNKKGNRKYITLRPLIHIPHYRNQAALQEPDKIAPTTTKINFYGFIILQKIYIHAYLRR
jgi:hypothetical protein